MIPALLCLVIAISDGDTLTARCPTQDAAHPYQQVKVRLAAIDAPERKQPYGERARQALAELTFQKQARLECGKTDRYKRSVCNVWVAPASAPDGPQTLDAGLAMVTQGMAWWYRAYSKEQTPEARGQYEFAEDEARARKAGLWAMPGAVAPWEWRRQSNKLGAQAAPVTSLSRDKHSITIEAISLRGVYGSFPESCSARRCV